ncbi:DUF4426 domain-containing protein [Saccharospirillum mangrovi]|uniref:DUF4426 domain-containing protein n=1 Tax=Saccharospirillum mangrovi TaxID=2161747 RepID=UPI0013007C17|nr:DUF4426 domain-containing protein [Saccharospirillum mangrovi]
MPIKIFAVLLFGLLGSISAQAEQKVVFNGDYELHYIVFNSTMLQPDIARQYNLTRGGRNAILNLSVLQQQPNGVATPVEAEVRVRVRDLLGQVRQLPLDVVREQNAIYHLGNVKILDREMLWFDIEVEIPGERDFDFSFSKEMWEEDA